MGCPEGGVTEACPDSDAVVEACAESGVTEACAESGAVAEGWPEDDVEAEGRWGCAVAQARPRAIAGRRATDPRASCRQERPPASAYEPTGMAASRQSAPSHPAARMPGTDASATVATPAASRQLLSTGDSGFGVWSVAPPFACARTTATVAITASTDTGQPRPSRHTGSAMAPTTPAVRSTARAFMAPPIDRRALYAGDRSMRSLPGI
jgi:hypothetical protein